MLARSVSQPHHKQPWPLWPLITALLVLFLGPLIAPLFQATALPLVADSGTLARDLFSRYVCPTPAKSYIIAGFPMAVCARCWGATIGLWLGYWAFTAAYRSEKALQPVRMFAALPWASRLLLALVPFGLWVLEITRWPAAPLWVLLLNGALAGFGAGLFFCSLWPGLAQRIEQPHLF